MEGNIRFQFGIARLIILTTVIAVVIAISIRIDAPKLTQGIVAAYFLFVVVWVVMRGPTVAAGLTDVYRRRGKLKDRRAELEREVLGQKRNRDVVRSADDSHNR